MNIEDKELKKSLEDNYKNQNSVPIKLSSFLSGEEHFDRAIINSKGFYVNVFYFKEGCSKLDWGKETLVFSVPTNGKNISSFINDFPNDDASKHPKIGNVIPKQPKSKILLINSRNPFWEEPNPSSYKTLLLEELSKTVTPTQSSETSVPQDEILKQKNIELAQDSFSSNKVMFFCGAGVSKSANLPDWSQLLKSLLKKGEGLLYQQMNEANAEALQEYYGNSNIITGRCILDGYEEYPDESLTRDEIVENKKKRNKEIVKRIRGALYKNTIINSEYEYSSELINSIAQAVQKHSNIKGIITYNYDDILDSAIEKKGKDSVSVYDITSIPTADKFPIYHVHGIIKREENDTLDQIVPVLSEKEYHKLYNDPQNWANVIQLYALNTMVCFLVGFSMTDPNQRRILEYARTQYLSKVQEMSTSTYTVKNASKHFVFLKKEGLKGEASIDVNKEHWEEVEDMMSDLGLNVIWFDDFDELPKIIDYIVK